MLNDVWLTLQKGIPMDVFMSKESAEKNKFHSETIEHFIRVDATLTGTSDASRVQQLERANAELSRQVEELTRMLEKKERRMNVLEDLVGVPVILRSKRTT